VFPRADGTSVIVGSSDGLTNLLERSVSEIGRVLAIEASGVARARRSW